MAIQVEYQIGDPVLCGLMKGVVVGPIGPILIGVKWSNGVIHRVNRSILQKDPNKDVREHITHS
jgi:hypothetical protein